MNHRSIATCYRLSVACQQWTSQSNTHYDKGQLNRAATLQMCQAACLSNATCTGLDWIPTFARGQQCWLSGPWSGAMAPYRGVTHYVLNRNCPGKLQFCDLAGIVMELHRFYAFSAICLNLLSPPSRSCISRHLCICVFVYLSVC